MMMGTEPVAACDGAGAAANNTPAIKVARVKVRLRIEPSIIPVKASSGRTNRPHPLTILEATAGLFTSIDGGSRWDRGPISAAAVAALVSSNACRSGHLEHRFIGAATLSPNMAKGNSWTMRICIDHAAARELRAIAPALTLLAALSGCSPQTETSAPQPRPVRTATVEQREAGVPITLTGRIEAEDEVALAFRISGRILDKDRKLGDRVEAGQVVARLESQNERNALRAAQANLVSAQGQLTQARNHFERQDTLLKQGWTTRANHDQAAQALQTATSQVDAAEAQLKTAYDQVSFTELRADAPGVVTAVGPGAGEVVQAGQMILRIARKDGRDAVFDVPAQMIRSMPSDPRIVVSLTDDPKITTT